MGLDCYYFTLLYMLLLIFIRRMVTLSSSSGFHNRKIIYIFWQQHRVLIVCDVCVSFNTTLICKSFTILNFTCLVEHPCLLICSEIKRKSWNHVTVTKQIHILFFNVVVQDIPRSLKCLFLSKT